MHTHTHIHTHTRLVYYICGDSIDDMVGFGHEVFGYIQIFPQNIFKYTDIAIYNNGFLFEYRLKCYSFNFYSSMNILFMYILFYIP